jgi:HMG box factor, other
MEPEATEVIKTAGSENHGKVPRPRNAFILYRQANAATWREEHPELSNVACSKDIGKQWREESEDIKQYWREQARKDGNND